MGIEPGHILIIMLNIQAFDDTPNTNWEYASQVLEELIRNISSNGTLFSANQRRMLTSLNDRFEQGERSNELYNEIMKFAVKE